MKKLNLLLFIFALFTSRSYAQHVIDSTQFEDVPVTLETPTGKIFGNILSPLHYKKGPVVLIIAGSGPTDRDGNNMFMKNNSLKQLAYSLADAGIPSLRFDKRGIAASTAAMTKEEDIRFDDYINDVKDWISFLRKNKRFTSVIIAGHSEGSLIGMIAANGNADKYISLAGAGEPISQTLKRQLKTQVPQMSNRCNSIIDSLDQGLTVSNTPKALTSLFRPSVQPYLISWFKYNPQKEIAKLSIPVLIIQGESDLQVTVNDAKMLSAAKPDAKLYLIKNMNHVFKTVTDDKDNYKSYGETARPISSEMVQHIIDFIRQ